MFTIRDPCEVKLGQRLSQASAGVYSEMPGFFFIFRIALMSILG